MSTNPVIAEWPGVTTSELTSNVLKMSRGVVGPAKALQTTHWGELVQGPIAFEGAIVTALITLPRPDKYSVASFTPGRIPLTVNPGWCTKALAAAREVLDRAGWPEFGGSLSIATNIPPGCGSGSTSADITATIRAVSRAVGLDLSAEEVQLLDWQIERAADPLALLGGGTVVYGSRIGRIIRRLTQQLPRIHCVGFNAEPGKMVLTEELARLTEYSPAEVKAFGGILARAVEGVERGSVWKLAAAATDSAKLNQARVSTQHFDELVRAAAAVGASGLSVSHSGTVAAALFDPATPSLGDKADSFAAAARDLGCADIVRFEVSGEEAIQKPRTLQ